MVSTCMPRTSAPGAERARGKSYGDLEAISRRSRGDLEAITRRSQGDLKAISRRSQGDLDAISMLSMRSQGQGAESVQAFGVVGWCDVAVADGGERHQRPVDGEEVLGLERGGEP